MIRFLFFVGIGMCAIAGNTSCLRSQMEPPQVMLGDSLLVKILTDSYILNAAFNQTSGTVKDSVSKAYSQQIIDKYEVSQEVLDENIQWLYSQNRIDTIFQMMMDRMDYLEDQISTDVKTPSR
ncbi:MAG: DUF4296 domain-containing protein [Saprospiraceae bacterium]|nr:DUF4296 domain-containing protein [Saprospiraceae bacterium]